MEIAHVGPGRIDRTGAERECLHIRLDEERLWRRFCAHLEHRPRRVEPYAGTPEQSRVAPGPATDVDPRPALRDQ